MTLDVLIVAALAVIALLMILARRGSGRYGIIKPSRNATEAYERFHVDPDRSYYISGSDLYPNAVIGLDKSWTLETDLWRKKDLDSHGMRELVQNMRRKALEGNRVLHGFDVYDNGGQAIGDWFSVMGIHATVRIIAEKTVAIDTPPIDTYGS
jgi:hypothetical protein